MIGKTITIQLNMGYEEHPIAFLVQKASQYKSSIYLLTENKKINAKSIMGMMALNLEQGMTVKITTEGPDETEAVKEIADYLMAM